MHAQLSGSAWHHCKQDWAESADAQKEETSWRSPDGKASLGAGRSCTDCALGTQLAPPLA